MTTKTYALDDILTVTTGRLLSRRHMDGLYDLLGYMTGDDLMTHQLPRAADACAPALLEQHPQLRNVEPPADADQADLLAWIDWAGREYGTELPVEPLTAGRWDRRNPIEELCDMVGPEKVIVVRAPGDDTAS